MTIETLQNELKKRAVPVTEDAFSMFEKLAALLKEWNEKFNLTAIDEPEEVYEKHILDCLLPLETEKLHGRICDVGSGAGFPGLVWAIVSPDCEFTLLEPTLKRCRYLEEAVRTLGLTNVTVVNERAEDYAKSARESFDVVTARAVANLTVLAELCVPLVKQGGVFLALKGPQGKAEAEEAAYALKKLGCAKAEVIETALPCGDGRSVVKAEKIKPTPAPYPRSYSQIKHRPLAGKE